MSTLLWYFVVETKKKVPMVCKTIFFFQANDSFFHKYFWIATAFKATIVSNSCFFFSFVSLFAGFRSGSIKAILFWLVCVIIKIQRPMLFSNTHLMKQEIWKRTVNSPNRCASMTRLHLSTTDWTRILNLSTKLVPKMMPIQLMLFDKMEAQHSQLLSLRELC